MVCASMSMSCGSCLNTSSRWLQFSISILNSFYSYNKIFLLLSINISLMVMGMIGKLNRRNVFLTFRILLILFLFVSSLELFFSSTNAAKSLYFNNESKLSISGSYIEVDRFCDTLYPRGFSTDFIHNGGILFVNFTNLLFSNSSVELKFIHDERHVWSPLPENFTLAPGENHNGTYQLDASFADGNGYIEYKGYVITANSSATIRFGYRVVLSGTEVIGFSSSLYSMFFVLFIIYALYFKRKINYRQLYK